ncbi:MAG TPA: hypothetical protein VHE35_24285 [Kofleriaceae bacterium]|nr:hypothetical protein [Kofleriaceae bacterium]
MTLTKLVFGLHVTETSITLTVDGQTPTDTSTQLVILKAGVSGTTNVSWDSVNERWQTTLTTGDHMVKMEVPSENEWFDGDLDITLSATSAFVYHGPETADPNQHVTVAWNDTTAQAGGSDPWPPPGTPVTLPSASLSWFTPVLHSYAINMNT